MTKRFNSQEALQAFDACLGSVWDMKQRKVLGHEAEFVRWKRNAESAIALTYGDESVWLKDFRAIPFASGEPVLTTFFDEPFETHLKLFDKVVALLESMRDQAQTAVARQQQAEENERLKTALPGKITAKDFGNRVFVVHGRDDGSKEKVARILEKLGLEPIILHEHPNRSRTIIEKFENYSDVGFAVVLLTADDLGRLEASSEAEKPRARQNVIFEFGYFIGKIGRDKVCALLESGVEKPSDIDGIVYVSLDAGDAWKMQLVKELKAVGYTVDANKAL